MGFVYFVEGLDTGRIKIGRATDFPARVSALRSSSAESLVVLGVMECDNPREREREVHARFASSRVRGEWFYPSLEMLEYIVANSEEHYDDHTEFTKAYLTVQYGRGWHDGMRARKETQIQSDPT